jgi:hypothetical protein
MVAGLDYATSTAGDPPMNATTLLPPADDRTLTENLPQPEWQGPRCDKCQAPADNGLVAVCAACGWYASLGIFVEVDPDEAQQARTGAAPVAEPQSFWQIWGNLVPTWAWILVGTQVAIIAASIGARLALPETGSMRAWWASSQLVVGLMASVVCHFVAFVMASASDVDIGVFDVVIKPIKAWSRLVAELPRKLSLLNTAVGGVVAALCAALIIGGIPWYVLLDWKFKQPPKQNLMGAVMSHAQSVQGEEKPLDEAVSDFAGTAGAANPGKAAKNAATDNSKAPRFDCDCLILGFEPSGDDGISELLLAAESGGKLVYVGRVTPRLAAEETKSLRHKLEGAKSARPFVQSPRTATWVAPRLTCRVSYTKKMDNGRLTDIEWDSLLGEMKIPW